MSERNERKTGRGDASKMTGAHRNSSGGGDGSHENGPKHKRTAGKDRDADKSGEARNEALTVLKQDPNNAEALLFLAESLTRSALLPIFEQVRTAIVNR